MTKLARAVRAEAVGTAPFFEKCYRYEDAARVRQTGFYSFFRVIESAQDPEVTIDGRRMVMLGSNNYLGLTNDPRVKEAAIEAIRKYGSGCAGSRFLNGTLDLHVRLEERLAEFMRQEAAVTFSTGFQVNLGAISCLVGKGDTVYLDKQDHACIIDGARLSFGDVKKFKHNDPADLRRQMRNDHESRGRLVVVDGVFSMEGDIAPLPEIVRVAREFAAGDHGGRRARHRRPREDRARHGRALRPRARRGPDHGHVLEVDGVGRRLHRGRRHRHRLHQAPRAHAHLLGRAAAGLGRRGPGDGRDHGPRAGAASDGSGRTRGSSLEGLRSIGLDTGESESPVVPVVVGEDMTALRMVHRLQEEGVFVNCVALSRDAAGPRSDPYVAHGDAHPRRTSPAPSRPSRRSAARSG